MSDTRALQRGWRWSCDKSRCEVERCLLQGVWWGGMMWTPRDVEHTHTYTNTHELSPCRKYVRARENWTVTFGNQSFCKNLRIKSGIKFFINENSLYINAIQTTKECCENLWNHFGKLSLLFGHLHLLSCKTRFYRRLITLATVLQIFTNVFMICEGIIALLQTTNFDIGLSLKIIAKK